MKIVEMKQTTRHPEFISGSANNGNDAADSKQIPHQVRDDWQYQGKRRDQVESGYKIFVFSILAALLFGLFALLMGL